MSTEDKDKKPGNFFSVLKFSSYELPEVKEVKNKDYILFGKDNDYRDKLISYYFQSSKHNAIINGKVDFICGGGWATDDQGAMAFIQTANIYNETLIDVTAKAVLDLEIFDGFSIHVVSKKGAKGYHVEHIPFNKVCTNKTEDKFYYTSDWTKRNPENNEDWREFIPFTPGGKGDMIFVYKKYTPKTKDADVYPMPGYSGSLPYIEADIEVAKYDLNNIKDSFLANMIFNFYNGQPGVEEQKVIEKQIEKKFTGTGGKKFMLNFADGKERGMEATPLNPNQNVDLFDQFNKRLKEEIFTGHRVTSPTFFGVMADGNTLGDDGGKLVKAYEMFKETYVSGKQQVIEDAFNFIYSGSRSGRALKLQEKSPVQETISINTILTDLTQDERRELAGYKPLTQPTQPTQQPVKKEFSAENEDRILAKFAAMGKDAADYEVLKVRRLRFSDDKDTILQAAEAELSLTKQCFATVASGKVADLEAGVLKILDKTPDASYDAIAKQLEVSTERVKSILTDLIDAGYLAKSGKTLSITPAGEEVIPPVTRETTEISVKYRYALSPDMPGPAVLPTTRKFCKEILGFNKLYTRQEIEQIANEEDYNVFLFRGGWYHNPSTGEATPHCRHSWESVVVTNKK